jgi:hypothetical protein
MDERDESHPIENGRLTNFFKYGRLFVNFNPTGVNNVYNSFTRFFMPIWQCSVSSFPCWSTKFISLSSEEFISKTKETICRIAKEKRLFENGRLMDRYEGTRRRWSVGAECKLSAGSFNCPDRQSILIRKRIYLSQPLHFDL